MSYSSSRPHKRPEQHLSHDDEGMTMSNLLLIVMWCRTTPVFA